MNERRCRTCWQLLELGLRDRRDLCNALLKVGGRLQEHLHNCNPIERLRLQVFDVVHGCSKVPLRNNDNPIGHILWDETGIGPDDAYDGNV